MKITISLIRKRNAYGYRDGLNVICRVFVETLLGKAPMWIKVSMSNKEIAGYDPYTIVCTGDTSDGYLRSFKWRRDPSSLFPLWSEMICLLSEMYPDAKLDEPKTVWLKVTTINKRKNSES